MTILVTGATGHLGRLVVDNLLKRGVRPEDIVAGARDVSKATDLARAGVRVTRLDYSDPASIGEALEGVDAVLLISSSEVGQRVVQHRAVIDAAAAAGVSKFVYTSAPRAGATALVLAPEHKATEEAIAASEIPAIILRNNWYTENYAADLARAAETGVVAASAGQGRVASASRVDYAEAAAVVLTEEGHTGQIYELGGDEAWTYDQLADAMSQVVGRPVHYQPLSTEEHAAALSVAGLDEGTIGFVTALDRNIADGDLAGSDGTLARLIGRPTTPLLAGLRMIA